MSGSGGDERGKERGVRGSDSGSDERGGGGGGGSRGSKSSGRSCIKSKRVNIITIAIIIIIFDVNVGSSESGE